MSNIFLGILELIIILIIVYTLSWCMIKLIGLIVKKF